MSEIRPLVFFHGCFQTRPSWTQLSRDLVISACGRATCWLYPSKQHTSKLGSSAQKFLSQWLPESSNTVGLTWLRSSLQGPAGPCCALRFTHQQFHSGLWQSVFGGSFGNSDSLKTARRHIIAFSSTLTLKMNSKKKKDFFFFFFLRINDNLKGTGKSVSWEWLFYKKNVIDQNGMMGKKQYLHNHSPISIMFPFYAFLRPLNLKLLFNINRSFLVPSFPTARINPFSCVTPTHLGRERIKGPR